jgi:hypothetical protein
MIYTNNNPSDIQKVYTSSPGCSSTIGCCAIVICLLHNRLLSTPVRSTLIGRILLILAKQFRRKQVTGRTVDQFIQFLLMRVS